MCALYGITEAVLHFPIYTLPAPFQPYGKSKSAHDALGKGWGGYEGEAQVLLAFPGVAWMAQGVGWPCWHPSALVTALQSWPQVAKGESQPETWGNILCSAWLWLTWDQARLVLRCRPDKQHRIHLILAISQTSGLFVLSLHAVKTQWIFPQKSKGYIFQSLSKPAWTVWCIR